MAKKEGAKKKLQAKDVKSKKVPAVDIKGGAPRVICISVRSLGMK